MRLKIRLRNVILSRGDALKIKVVTFHEPWCVFIILSTANDAETVFPMSWKTTILTAKLTSLRFHEIL